MSRSAGISPPAGKLASQWPTMPSRGGRPRLGDILFRVSCQAAALSVVVISILLLVVLIANAWPAMETIGARFLTSKVWDPEPEHRLFGALAFVYGTVATSIIALVIAVPLGVASAAFLSEIAPGWVQRVGSFLVEMLAAVPSVVYGFCGLFVLAPLMQRIFTALGGPNEGGVGIVPAGIILSVMIVPYVASVAYDTCRAVPRSQREASLALGATRWQTIWSVVLPYARPGIVGGCFLALGRALGETMAVTMLIGNKTEIHFSFFALGNSIASVIANELAEASYDLHQAALVELGLLLLIVTVLMNVAARLLLWQVTRSRSSPRGSSEETTSTPVASASRNGDAFVVSKATGEPTAPRRRELTAVSQGWNTAINRLMTGVLALGLLSTIVPLFLILGYLLVRGFSSLSWDFFTHLPAPVGEPGGGMRNAIYGSFLLVGLATAAAVPIGMMAAIYLAEYRRSRLGTVVRFVAELLGGVPSIVIGIFGYALIVRPMGHFSGYAGSFALAVMMLPIVVRAGEEALKLIPDSLRQASYALGASQWQTIVRVIVPAALPAIITAVFLAIARVAGETAPLLLTALSNQYMPTSPNDFMPSLPVYIFNYAISPFEDWHRQAWAAALVLVLTVMILNFGVRLASGKRAVMAGRAD